MHEISLRNGTRVVLSDAAPPGYEPLPRADSPARDSLRTYETEPVVLGAWACGGPLAQKLVGSVAFGLYATAPILVRPKSEPGFLIGNLDVDAAVRNEGIGLELLLTALTHALPLQPGPLHLTLAQMRCFVWIDIGDTATERLYKHCGFQTTGHVHPPSGPKICRFVRNGYSPPLNAHWTALSPTETAPEHHEHTREIWQARRARIAERQTIGT